MCRARSTFSARAVRSVAWDAERDGWAVCGAWVREWRSEGEERIVAMSCLLLGVVSRCLLFGLSVGWKEGGGGVCLVRGAYDLSWSIWGSH